MKKLAALLLLCSFPAALWAGFSLGRPAAVKKRVSALDDKVLAAQKTPAPSPPPPAGPNSAPSFTASAAVSTTIAAGGLTSLSAAATDPDGDTLSYVWSSTAGAIGGSGASVYWLAPSTPGVYAVTCQASDASLSVSTSVLVKAVSPGTPAWTFTASAPLYSNAAAVAGSSGTVYTVDTVDKLYAIDKYGAQKWAFSTENHDAFDFQPFVAPDGTVYVVAAGTKVYAVAADGSLKWGPSAPAVNNLSAPPVIGPDGRLYVHDPTASAVYSLDPATGVGVATFTALANGVSYPPVTGPGNSIYIVSNDGVDDILYAVPAAGLGASTQTAVTGIGLAPLVGRDGSAYWTDGFGNVSAVSPDGTAKWAAAFVYSPSLLGDIPVLGLDGNVYAVNNSNRVVRISSADGSGFEFFSFPALTALPAAGPDGVVYAVATADISAATPADDAKWGPYTVPAPATAIAAPPAVGADGTVYVITDAAPSGKLVALRSTSALP